MIAKIRILVLVLILLSGGTLLMRVETVRGAGPNSRSGPLLAARSTYHHSQISRDQAVNIALNAHKRAKLLSVRRYRNIYVIRLKTLWGKRTVKIGANTGRILYDRLDWTVKSK